MPAHVHACVHVYTHTYIHIHTHTHDYMLITACPPTQQKSIQLHAMKCANKDLEKYHKVSACMHSSISISNEAHDIQTVYACL